MITKFDEFLNEGKKSYDYDKIVSKFNLKKYPTIIPPDDKEECIKILLKDFEKDLKDDPENTKVYFGEGNEEGMGKEEFEDGTIEQEIRKIDIESTRHEVVHAIQKKKYPEMLENELAGKEKFWSTIFDNYENHKIYLSIPGETMAYAFSWVVGDEHKMFGKTIKQRYEDIGGKVLDFFNEYVKEYKEKLKK